MPSALSKFFSFHPFRKLWFRKNKATSRSYISHRVTEITKTRSFDCELSVVILDRLPTELYLRAVQSHATDDWQILGEVEKTQPEQFKFRATFITATDHSGSSIQLMTLRRLEKTEDGAYLYVTSPSDQDHVSVVEYPCEIPDQPLDDDPRLLLFYDLKDESASLDSTFVAPKNKCGSLWQVNKDRSLVLQRFDDRPNIDISHPSRRDRRALLLAAQNFRGFDFHLQQIEDREANENQQ